MKIVHLIDYIQPQLGYQEYFLAKEEQREGNKVSVICSNYYFPFPNYQRMYKNLLGKRKRSIGQTKEEGIEIYRLRSLEIIPGKIILLFNLPQILEKLKPELLICHNIFSLTSYFAAYYKKRLGYKLIYDSHASYFNTNFNSSLPKKIYFSLYKKFFSPKILKEKDVIFAIGEKERAFLVSHLGLDKSKIPIIRLGVDTKLFKYSPPKRSLTRKKFNIDKKDMLVLYAGKITPNKDLHILFDSLKSLNKLSIKLMIIGNGDSNYLKSLMQKLPSKKIIHLNTLKNSSLPLFYQAADLGIWPGDPSITMLEAMSCGVPLIIPESKQTEYLKKDKGVDFFNRGDIINLSQKIKYFYQNTDFRKEMSKKAQKYVKIELSWQKINKKILKLVKNDKN